MMDYNKITHKIALNCGLHIENPPKKIPAMFWV